MSQHFSMRLRSTTYSQLKSTAQRRRQAPRTLAQSYVEEGLRQDEHPLVRFKDGPAGRRPSLLGTGLDVWEVIATLRDSGDDPVETARYLDIPTHLVQAAIAYYGSYRDEIDEWIEEAKRETDEAHSVWLAGQQALEN